MISMLSPSAIKAAWAAYRPAPEDAKLRRLRRTTMAWNAAAALAVALVRPITRIHVVLVLLVAAIAVQAVAVTIRYWRTKNHIDSEYQAGAAKRGSDDAGGGEGGAA